MDIRHTVFIHLFLFSNIFILALICGIGTHVAGIIAANATGITEMGYIPNIPFVGVAPQVTLGACKLSDFYTKMLLSLIHRYFQDRVFGCSGFTTSGTLHTSALLFTISFLFYIICQFLCRCDS